MMRVRSTVRLASVTSSRNRSNSFGVSSSLRLADEHPVGRTFDAHVTRGDDVGLGQLDGGAGDPQLRQQPGHVPATRNGLAT